MYFNYNDEKYEIIIERKKMKNIYIKVKEDLKVYVSCNRFVSEREINKLIENNYKSICRMIELQKNKQEKNEEFYYLGNKYDVVFISTFNNIQIENNKIYAKDINMLDKWLKKEILRIFNEEVSICVDNFKYKIPHFKLRIRCMKTRWGVCNRGNNTITLNSLLIRYEKDIIDYVIYHELSHFIEANHSKNFWKVVESHIPNYKILRNRLKN